MGWSWLGWATAGIVICLVLFPALFFGYLWLQEIFRGPDYYLRRAHQGHKGAPSGPIERFLMGAFVAIVTKAAWAISDIFIAVVCVFSLSARERRDQLRASRRGEAHRRFPKPAKRSGRSN